MKLQILSLVLALSISSAAQIKVCVQKSFEQQTGTLSNARVRCYDEDIDSDDFMAGSAYTGSNGCVTLSYTKKTPKWYNPCTAWDCPGYTNPDIYCKITKSGYYKLFTNTKEDHNQNNLADFGTVTIYKDRSNHPGTMNGCGPADLWSGITNVANFLTGFEDQCNNHDKCYNNCQETKSSCDLEFLYMMYSKCNDSWDFENKSPCKTAADKMFELVRDRGESAFNEAQSECT